MDHSRLAAVMRPKALGAWHLHRHTAQDPVEHFVLFSSVAQVIGNRGQGAYCAANAFLDGLARHRRAEGRAGLSIAWGVLSDTGVAARADGLVAQLRNLGIRPFTASRALTVLGSLMDDAPANIVFADMDWARWASHAEAAATPRFGQVAQLAGGSDRFAAFRREVVALPASERHGAIATSLRGALAVVLGMPADRIASDRSLDGLGVDSLMALELTVGLEEQFGIKLPTALLMQGPTVASLAEHLLREALAVERLDGAALDSLTEAEADAMLEMLAAAGDLELDPAQ